MRLVMFCHSLISDWNHGNAHFLRGIACEFLARGHSVAVYEEQNAWSMQNLTKLHGKRAEVSFCAAYPELEVTRYDANTLDLPTVLRDADLVLVHEWNPPELVEKIGRCRAQLGTFKLFFHDTHHRAITAPQEIARFDLSAYDGVLAFGAAVSRAYEECGWHSHVWTWHEAADARRFHGHYRSANGSQPPQGDIVWIGNWGDEERTEELREFLLRPVKELDLKARVYGVRYPDHALRELKAANIEYGGWLPNYAVPGVFAQFRTTIHIPRRPYAEALPGIPTIRMFEALACKIPLVSAPWSDTENLFTAGSDYLIARNGDEMVQHLWKLLSDSESADQLAAHGRETILSRHTCAHRVGELLGICGQTVEVSREVHA